jgi:hypothetical protein
MWLAAHEREGHLSRLQLEAGTRLLGAKVRVQLMRVRLQWPRAGEERRRREVDEPAAAVVAAARKRGVKCGERLRRRQGQGRQSVETQRAARGAAQEEAAWTTAQWQAAACVRVQRWWRVRSGKARAHVCQMGGEIARECRQAAGGVMDALATDSRWRDDACEESRRSEEMTVWQAWPRAGHPLAARAADEPQLVKTTLSYRRVGAWEAMARATWEVRARGGRAGARQRNAARRPAEIERRQVRDLQRYLQGLACNGGEPEGPTGLQAWLYDFDEPLEARADAGNDGCTCCGRELTRRQGSRGAASGCGAAC